MLMSVGNLFEGRRDLLKTLDVVVVVFLRVELDLGDKLRQIRLQAVELVHRHLPRLEPRFLLFFDQLAHHEFFAQIFLVGHPSRVYLAQAIEKGSAARERVVVRRDGIVRELIRIALVADRRCEFRGVLEIVFPNIAEDGVQRLPASFERVIHPVLCGGRDGLRDSNGGGEKEEKKQAGGQSFSEQAHTGILRGSRMRSVSTIGKECMAASKAGRARTWHRMQSFRHEDAQRGARTRRSSGS